MSQRATRPAKSPPTDGVKARAGAAKAPVQRIGRAMSSSGLGQRIAAPHSLAEAEEQYVACRDAWTAAMRAAGSGRPADMATLAICQEAYEAASLERDRWLSGARARAAIPIERGTDRASIEVVVDQALAWQDVHDHAKPRGLLGRLFGRRRKD